MIWGFVTGENFQKIIESKSKREVISRNARVIKKQSFHSHCRINNLSCHHIFKKIHSITTLKANHYFISRETPPPSKDKTLGFEDPNSLMWGT
jgi:hypothetical protein